MKPRQLPPWISIRPLLTTWLPVPWLLMPWLLMPWLLMLGPWSTAAGAQPQPGVEAAVALELRTRLEAAIHPGLKVAGEPIHAVTELPRFYRARIFGPAWTAGPDMAAAAKLVNALRSSEREGLRPQDYHLETIESLLTSVRAGSAKPGAPSSPSLLLPQVLGDLDLLLTDAFLIYGAHLVSGRIDPESFDPEWHAVRREVDLVERLEHALSTGTPYKTLMDLRPADPGYGRLRAALDRYRGLDDWLPILGEGPIEAGDVRLEALRERLRLTGDWQPPSPEAGASEIGASDVGASEIGASDVGAESPKPKSQASPEKRSIESFDPSLGAAVKAFQARHGLADDGVVGSKTLAALNVSRQERVQQIVLNLERWRWLPTELGRRYVLVDIPAFRLRAMDGPDAALEMRIVVGRSYRRTPVMSDIIRYLVLNPFWEVPTSLAIKDKLPEIRKDVGMLGRMGIEVLQGWGRDEKIIDPSTVDWSKLGPRAFPYRLRQNPGPLNALGRVKIMFPNPFNVYVHDTPSRELFQRPERAASSGCIRAEKPLELSAWLLQSSKDWSLERLNRVVDSGETTTVSLPEPIPVHLQYWTVSVDSQGVVGFRNDIYQRDAALTAALAMPPPGDSP